MENSQNEIKIDDEADDYDGYFLVPVNEYKIADKIIEANKSLFESINQTEIRSEDINEDDNQLIGLNLKKPRVTFSSDIEEYEDDDDDDDDENASIQSNANEDYDESNNKSILNDNHTTEPSIECNNNELTEPDKQNESMENIEEICEDIDIIKLNPSDDNEIMEEIFENIAEIDVQIDGEKIDSIENDNLSCPLEISNEMDTNEVQERETIVANLNDTQQIHIAQENCPKPEIKSKPIRRLSKSASEQQSQKLPSTANMRKSQTAPILRKTNQSHNISKTEHSRRKVKSSTSSNQIDHDEVDELLRIQLNFKCCCEHKYLANSRLPRYKGYFSQYGLSKEELDARAARKELMKKLKYENWLRKNEEKQLKSEINEHAYAQWLKEKLQKVGNKEKNMYDFSTQNKQKQTAPTLQHLDSWKY